MLYQQLTPKPALIKGDVDSGVKEPDETIDSNARRTF